MTNATILTQAPRGALPHLPFFTTQRGLTHLDNVLVWARGAFPCMCKWEAATLSDPYIAVTIMPPPRPKLWEIYPHIPQGQRDLLTEHGADLYHSSHDCPQKMFQGLLMDLHRLAHWSDYSLTTLSPDHGVFHLNDWATPDFSFAIYSAPPRLISDGKTVKRVRWEPKPDPRFDNDLMLPPNARYSFNGGLLYHGSHDGFGSGKGPTFAVTLTPTHGWSIHT